MSNTLLVRTIGHKLLNDTSTGASIRSHRPTVILNSPFIEIRLRGTQHKKPDLEVICSNVEDKLTDEMFEKVYRKAAVNVTDELDRAAILAPMIEAIMAKKFIKTYVLPAKKQAEAKRNKAAKETTKALKASQPEVTPEPTAAPKPGDAFTAKNQA